MPLVTMKFTFMLPYGINVTEGQVTEDIVIPLAAHRGRITIRPPKVIEEKRFIYQSPEKKIWLADKIEINIEMEAASITSFDDLRSQIEPLAKDYLKRFLKYCRVETAQFWIDLRPEINPSRVVYVNQDGHEQTGPVSLTLRMYEFTSLDDSSWKAVRQNLRSKAQIPFYKEALLDAKLYLSHDDYRMAAVSAAMGIEVIVIMYLRKRLTQELVDENRTSQSQVDKFLEDVSNRVLATVALGLFLSVEREVLESCRSVLELRNRILHGMKTHVSSKDAREAIKTLEKLVSADEIRETLSKRGSKRAKGEPSGES